MTLEERLQEDDVIDLPDWAAAKKLNDPDESLPLITEWQKTQTGLDGILEALGPDEGTAFLEALETGSSSNTLMKWALRIIERGVLDLSLESVRNRIVSITQPPFEILTLTQAEQLFALSKTERYPSWAEYYQIEVTPRTVGLARGGI